MTSGYTAELGEKDKHSKNDIPYVAWVCVPLVVEVFGGWGVKRHKKLSQGLPRIVPGLRC